MIKPLILQNIPDKKLKDALDQSVAGCQASAEELHTGTCPRCIALNKALHRYAEANIPVRYWDLEMNKDFHGSSTLLDTFNSIVIDLKAYYRNGAGLCFVGSYGCGKTMTICNILKRAVCSNYTAHYSTLSELVNVLTSGYDEKALCRNYLLTVDFLAIDEFDPRFVGSDNAAELFGRILEDIFRTRAQNKLPLFMCSNSPNPVETFQGAIKQSISSLMNYIKVVPVLGNDYRITEKNERT